jgi:2'-5' RNA ligase
VLSEYGKRISTEGSIVPYAVYLEVDPDTSNRLDRLSNELLQLNPSISTPHRFEHSHHLTIAVYNNIATETVIEAMTSMLGRSSSLDIRIPGLGCFPGKQSVLFAAPVPTKSLIQFHESYHNLAGLQEGSLSLYRPGFWFPHITIASGMTSRQAGNAVSMMAESWKAIEGSLDTAKLVSLTPTKIIWSGRFR